MQGTQDEIIDNVTGKVFETILDKAALASFKEKHLVVSTSRKNGMLAVRYISSAPAPDSVKCAASLEDAYLSFTNKSKQHELVY